MPKATAKTKEHEAYVKATEVAKELTNLKRRNPDGKNVKTLQERLDKQLAKMDAEQSDAILAWAEALPE